MESYFYIVLMGKLQGQSSFFKLGPPAQIGEAHQPIVDFLLKEAIGTSILDIGGGCGSYALEMKANGFDPLVVDVDEEALKTAKENGVRVKKVSPNEDIGSELADTVILIEVLEHVDDPKAFLEKAIRAARKRVLFTLPCTNDFTTLFNLGLSYSHIAVTDHLWHFSYSELENILKSIGKKYRLEVSDYLFPHMVFALMRNCTKFALVGRLAFLPIRVLNRLGFIKKSIPSRFYGIIDMI